MNQATAYWLVETLENGTKRKEIKDDNEIAQYINMNGFRNQLWMRRREKKEDEKRRQIYNSPRIRHRHRRKSTGTQDQALARSNEEKFSTKYRSTWIKCKQNCDFINFFVVFSVVYFVFSFSSQCRRSVLFAFIVWRKCDFSFLLHWKSTNFFHFASYWTLFILGYDFFTSPPAQLRCIHPQWRREKNRKIRDELEPNEFRNFI